MLYILLGIAAIFIFLFGIKKFAARKIQKRIFAEIKMLERGMGEEAVKKAEEKAAAAREEGNIKRLAELYLEKDGA